MVRDVWPCGWVGGSVCVISDPRFIQLALSMLLHCAHKRIVKIMKVYIERHHILVELIRFRTQNIDFIHFYVYEATKFANHSMCSAYSLDGSNNWSRTNYM